MNLPAFLYFVYPSERPDYVAVSLKNAREMAEHPEHVGFKFKIERWKLVGRKYQFDRTVQKQKVVPCR